jgi:hypothetical protein
MDMKELGNLHWAVRAALGVGIMLGGAGVASGAGLTPLVGTASTVVSDGDVTPFLIPRLSANPNQRTCSDVGSAYVDDGTYYEFSSDRLTIGTDGSISDGTLPTGVQITLTPESNPNRLAYTSSFPIGAVIVRSGGDRNNVYASEPQRGSDANLSGGINPGGQYPRIENITFCWNATDCEWSGETAWSNGDRYTTRGNWATFTQYSPGLEVALLAGQTKNAGTVTFSAIVDGQVTVSIDLEDGWRFADVDENVKVQDYQWAPEGNPSPGLFAHKAKAESSPFSIMVPANAYYGVHVDVEQEVCATNGG